MWLNHLTRDARAVLLYNACEHSRFLVTRPKMNASHAEGQSYLPFCLLVNPHWAVLSRGPLTIQEWKCPECKTQGIGTKPSPLSSHAPITLWMCFFQRQQEGESTLFLAIPLCGITRIISTGANRVQSVRYLIWRILGYHLPCRHVQWVYSKAFTRKQQENHF